MEYSEEGQAYGDEPEGPLQMWEYIVVVMGGRAELQQELNTLGAQGWEAVSMSQFVGSGDNIYTVIMKRRKQ